MEIPDLQAGRRRFPVLPAYAIARLRRQTSASVRTCCFAPVAEKPARTQIQSLRSAPFGHERAAEVKNLKGTRASGNGSQSHERQRPPVSLRGRFAANHHMTIPSLTQGSDVLDYVRLRGPSRSQPRSKHLVRSRRVLSLGNLKRSASGRCQAGRVSMSKDKALDAP